MRENTVRYQRHQRIFLIALLALTCQVACAPTALRTASRHGVRPGGPADESDMPDDEGGARRLPMGRRAALVDVDDAALNEIDDADDERRVVGARNSQIADGHSHHTEHWFCRAIESPRIQFGRYPHAAG